MATPKFEDQLKQRLEKRHIQPNENAWDRLERDLNSHSESLVTRKLWWIGIAASFVGVLLVITFLNNEESPINVPEVVETEVQDWNESQQQKPTVEDIKSAIPHVAEESVPLNKFQKSAISPPQDHEQIAQQQTTLNAENELNKVVLIEEKNEAAALSFEDQKALELASQISAMQFANDSVKAVEIDALLAEAQKEIQLKKLYDDTSQRVDANALLQSVEHDLEKSFRDKVFEALKSGYISVKTAVAERNN